MTQQLAPLPVSQAKNAYELLGEVCHVIREEPRRFRMDSFATYLYKLRDSLPDSRKATLPDCGTVCCVGGWVCVLKGIHDWDEINGTSALPLLTGYVFQRCEDDYTIRSEPGFIGAVANLFYNFDPFLGLDWGTPEYAEVGVAHLHEFMTRWEQELKAVTYP